MSVWVWELNNIQTCLHCNCSYHLYTAKKSPHLILLFFWVSYLYAYLPKKINLYNPRACSNVEDRSGHLVQQLSHQLECSHPISECLGLSHGFTSNSNFLLTSTLGGSRPCHSYRSPELSSQLPALSWFGRSWCRHSESEPVFGRSLSIYLFISNE